MPTQIHRAQAASAEYTPLIHEDVHFVFVKIYTLFVG